MEIIDKITHLSPIQLGIIAALALGLAIVFKSTITAYLRKKFNLYNKQEVIDFTTKMKQAKTFDSKKSDLANALNNFRK